MYRGRCKECGEAFLSVKRADTCSRCAGEVIHKDDTDERLRREAVVHPQGRKQTLDVNVLREAEFAAERTQQTPKKTTRKKKATNGTEASSAE